ncbi:phosphotransferase [Lysinibacter cavernae]|uniref:Aminoglycoside phosphotransferase (APT) family kinase protein n=1 Tax=Lysinibacter cavernae TaxID=1640652 RepID=A0A7X5TSL1_9MICO|nr:phosphotransferase [Lysinibacter cavernae]NIH52358.1 aminoglycoside phosphotransferase (APT) family kinase protein [Lysinibacter cavernae]
MVRSHLTLAALATSAVSNLEVTQVHEHTFGGSGDYTSAVLGTAGGEQLIIRIPTSQTAETHQSADLLGLAALTQGARKGLPFAVAEPLGQTRAGNTRAVVYGYLEGRKVDENDLGPDTTAIPSLAKAIAAIHRLPSSLIIEAGLPVRSAAEVREETTRLLARAEATRLVPSSVLNRWQAVMNDTDLWQFSGTVVNGGLSADSFLFTEDAEVAAILDWSELRVSDPALDFAWLTSAPSQSQVTVVAEYAQLRDIPNPVDVLRRAEFYSELNIARWLLHGKDSHDQNVVDDAVNMFAVLVDRISVEAERAGASVMSVTQVQDYLDQVPADVSLRTRTEAEGLLDDSQRIDLGHDEFDDDDHDGVNHNGANDDGADHDRNGAGYDRADHDRADGSSADRNSTDVITDSRTSLRDATASRRVTRPAESSDAATSSRTTGKSSPSSSSTHDADHQVTEPIERDLLD